MLLKHVFKSSLIAGVLTLVLCPLSARAQDCDIAIDVDPLVIVSFGFTFLGSGVQNYERVNLERPDCVVGDQGVEAIAPLRLIPDEQIVSVASFVVAVDDPSLDPISPCNLIGLPCAVPGVANYVGVSLFEPGPVDEDQGDFVLAIFPD